MKNIKFLIITILILLFIGFTLYFAYKGFFPFNSGKGKQFHYWVFDNYHLAFNIPNYNYNNIPYYCKISHNEQIMNITETNQKYQNDINEIQKTINKLRQSKYYLPDYDRFKVQSLYDRAHIFNDYYYVQQANNELKVLQSKQEHNSKCDALIKKFEDEIKYINEVLIPANNEKILDYCVKLL